MTRVVITEGDGSIRLDWDAVNDATRYRYRNVTSGSAGEWATTTSRSVTFSDLTPGQVYVYELQAGDADEWGDTFPVAGTAMADSPVWGSGPPMLWLKTGWRPATSTLVGSFSELPEDGHGGNPFTFRFTVDDWVDASSATIRDTVVTAQNGTISRAQPVVGEDYGWLITVTPDGTADVTLGVATATSCDDAAALCSLDGRLLTTSNLSAVVTGPGTTKATAQATGQVAAKHAPDPAPEPETSRATDQVAAKPEPEPAPEPLTATWSPPASHDGTAFTFPLAFNKPVQVGFRNLRDEIIEADDGSVTKARRAVRGSNQYWDVTVVPDGKGDVTLRLNVRGACGDDTAICTEEGELLATGLKDTVSG